MELVICGIPFGTPAETDALTKIKELRFTSVQIYVFWRDFEPNERGKFVWDELDRQVQLIQDAGLGFVPFLLIGPRYATPDWWLSEDHHVGLRCLEHDKESPIESIWNPAFREEITRILTAFADHYLPWGVLESVQPGICGDYGEAIYPALGNWPGCYHTHRGYWCGGDDAREAFRRHVEQEYGTVAELNRTWRANYTSFSEVEPFLPHHAPSRTAQVAFIDWYKKSMTDYAEFWMAECRRIFPDIPAYLCTGGEDAETSTGALFSDQAKVAAKHNGGLRLTNEGNKFDYNFPLTAHPHAACQFYGAYLGLEPVGGITQRGITARMFGSAAFGNRQMFHYYANVFDSGNNLKPGADAISQYAPLLIEQPVDKGIAFFWPIDQMVLHGKMDTDLKDALNYIRHQYPVSPINEQMILDGALEQFSSLVMINTVTTRASVLQRIAEWVTDKGGCLLAADLCRDLELEPVKEFEALFGITPESEEAWGHVNQNMHAPEGFRRLSNIAAFHVERGWLDLMEDTEKLAVATKHLGGAGGRANMQIEAVSSLFRRCHPSGGQAIFYCGPVSLDYDPERLFANPGVFAALLDDVCAMSGIENYHPEDDDIARGRIESGLLALREEGIVFVHE